MFEREAPAASAPVVAPATGPGAVPPAVAGMVPDEVLQSPGTYWLLSSIVLAIVHRDKLGGIVKKVFRR
jgi:hypothetical protein